MFTDSPLRISLRLYLINSVRQFLNHSLIDYVKICCIYLHYIIVIALSPIRYFLEIRLTIIIKISKARYLLPKIAKNYSGYCALWNGLFMN